MFNRTEGKGSVLGICVTPASFTGQSAALDYRAVHSARRAMDMLRLVRFDMLLVNLHLPDVSVWNFMRHVKTVCPRQKWSLVGSVLTKDQEIAARMFDVTTVFEVAPAIDEVCDWKTFSDVIRSAKCISADEVARQRQKIAANASVRYSKQAPAFEITGLNRGAAGSASYDQNTAYAAV
jgi:hypothetical protein